MTFENNPSFLTTLLRNAALIGVFGLGLAINPVTLSTDTALAGGNDHGNEGTDRDGRRGGDNDGGRGGDNDSGGRGDNDRGRGGDGSGAREGSSLGEWFGGNDRDENHGSGDND